LGRGTDWKDHGMNRRSAVSTTVAVLLGVGLLVGTTVSTAAEPTAAAVPTPAATGMPAGQLTALSAALGTSFAGAWIDEATGRMVVGTTDAADVRSIRAAGAQPAVLPLGLDMLESVMSALDARAGSAPDAVTGWFVDPASNSVVVRATDQAAAESFADGIGDAGAVRIEEVAEAPRPMADLVGGEGITGEDGARCSIGFSATSGGTDYVITAGHCTGPGGTWFGSDATAIGPVARRSYPVDDYGLIRVDSPSWTASSLVARSGGRISVTGATEAPVGASVCGAGSTSGFVCGTVQARNQTVNYGNGQVIYGLIRTNICSQFGDSGGPLLAGAQAQGVLSGGITCSLTAPGESLYQPVGEILAATGLDLVTGG
jgi:streptogrisin C